MTDSTEKLDKVNSMGKKIMDGANGNKKNEIVDTLTTVAKAAGSAATSASRKVKNMIDAQSLKGMLKDGNIVQLVSLSSGKTIQILQTEDGQLILDGQGRSLKCLYSHFKNVFPNTIFITHFNVCKDPVDHGLRLHNQFNYLAIVNGTVALIHQDGRQKAHPATRFKVKAENGNSIQFESVQERRSFIEVTPNGKVRSSAHGSMDSADAQFSINIIVMEICHRLEKFLSLFDNERADSYQALVCYQLPILYTIAFSIPVIELMIVQNMTLESLNLTLEKLSLTLEFQSLPDALVIVFTCSVN
ncbi:hypothetical protein GQR58_024050 [Nymphon striatum]|nr:hypothetical protein GQR58_024050 [Nymphon striatum]